MGRSKTIPLETKLKLISEYSNGDSSSMLAERYSIHQTTVLRIIRDKTRFMTLKQQKQDNYSNHRDNLDDEYDVGGDDEDRNGDQIQKTQEIPKRKKRRKSSNLTSTADPDQNRQQPMSQTNSNNTKDGDHTTTTIMNSAASMTNPKRSYPKFSKCGEKNLNHLTDDNISTNVEGKNGDFFKEHNKIIAFKKFFEYIDKIEEIALAHDPDFEGAFQFTRNLNNASLRYRYLLYELEKRNHIQKRFLMPANKQNKIFSSLERSSSSSMDYLAIHPAKQLPLLTNGPNDVSMEFCNLIRSGISRAS